MTLQEITNLLRDFFATEFRDMGVKIHDKMDLAKDLYVDSLSTVKVVFFLEKRFKIKISADEVKPSNFQNIETLARYVAEKQGNRE